MRLAIALLLAIGGSAYAGQDIQFRQDGLPVTSVEAGSGYSPYFILGSVSVKSDYVNVCVDTTGGNDYCIAVLTDNHGFYSTYSFSDPSGCQFEIAPDFVTCDLTPRTLNFSIQKQSTNRIMATGSLELEAE